MLNRGRIWKRLAQDESILIDTRIIADGTTYTDVLAPAITRALMPESVSIGNAISSMCTFSLDSSVVMPRSAEIKMEMRLTNGEDAPDDITDLFPVETVSGSVVTIDDATEDVAPVVSLRITIDPQQEGSGTPGPNNLRPIVGLDRVNLYVSPTNSAQDGNNYQLRFPASSSPVCSGTVDVINGTVTSRLAYNKKRLSTYDTRTNLGNGYYEYTWTRFFSSPVVGGTDGATRGMCNIAPYSYGSSATTHCFAYRNSTRFTVVLPNTVSQNTEVEAAMELSRSTGFNVGATAIQLLDGTNYIWSDAGDVRLQYRADPETGQVNTSEWLPVGTFYLSRRTKDPINGIIAFECYDSMLKANAPWNTEGLTFPVAMNVAAQHIATLIGVEIDGRTTIATGANYMIDEPAEGTLMRDILATIAGYNGGNWIITPENKLRLVRIDDSGEVQTSDVEVYSGDNKIYAMNSGQHLVIYSGDSAIFDTDNPGVIELYSGDERIYDNSGACDISAVIGSVGALPESTITGIRCGYEDGTSYLVGDDTGIVVDASIPGAIAAELIERIAGTPYQPFTLGDAFYDPAIELGDKIKYYDLVLGNLASEMITLDGAAQGTLAAPDTQELADEYPYYGQTPKTLAVAKAYAEQATQRLSESLTQKDVFNRLTNNGAAQGLFLTDDGQLFVNATYLGAGEIDAVIVRIKNLSANDISTGIIHSADYQVIDVPLIYPTTGLYPATDLYPSNGEQVVSGFAIDFSTGQIYGGLYSDEISTLQQAISDLQVTISEMQSALVYPKEAE